jgi:hypothetical protein
MEKETKQPITFEERQKLYPKFGLSVADFQKQLKIYSDSACPCLCNVWSHTHKHNEKIIK